MRKIIQKRKIIHNNPVWDDTWENVFQKQEWGKYPPEELVRFVGRNFYKSPSRKKVKFLDLGCGTGACSWYLAREGFSVFGVDGSKTAISLTKKRFSKEKLSGAFQVMDYINLDFPENYFDVVIDVCSIQCNKIERVPEIVQNIKRILKPGGKFFSILVTKGTSKVKGFQKKGYIHYYELSELKKIFKILKIQNIEKLERTENNRKDKIIHWILIGEK